MLFNKFVFVNDQPPVYQEMQIWVPTAYIFPTYFFSTTKTYAWYLFAGLSLQGFKPRGLMYTGGLSLFFVFEFLFLGGLGPIHRHSSAMLKLSLGLFFVLTRAVFVTIYILFISKSPHLLYCGICSSSNLSNSAAVISLIAFAILLFSFILNVFSFLQYK